MRLATIVPASLILCTGCTSADPTMVLREFALYSCDQAYSTIWDAVDAEHDIWQPADLSLSGSGETGDGLAYEYQLDADESDTLEDEITYSWTIEVELDGLELDSAVVDGSGSWTVEHVRYDLQYAHHAWVGELSVDGQDAEPADFESYFSGNLHWVTGSLGETEVDWEHANPDLP